jgi:hypothetical protein
VGAVDPTPLESDAVNEEMVAQANQNLGETMRDLRNYLLTTMRATDASEVWEIQKILSGSQEMRIEEDPDDLERNIREGKFMCDAVDGRSVYRKMTDEDSLSCQGHLRGTESTEAEAAMPATMTRVLDPGEIIHANQAHLAVHKATAGQDQEFMNCDSCAVQNLVSAKKFFPIAQEVVACDWRCRRKESPSGPVGGRPRP